MVALATIDSSIYLTFVSKSKVRCKMIFLRNCLRLTAQSTVSPSTLSSSGARHTLQFLTFCLLVSLIPLASYGQFTSYSYPATTLNLTECAGNSMPTWCGGITYSTTNLGTLVNYASGQLAGGGHIEIPAATYQMDTEIVPQNNISYDCDKGATLSAGEYYQSRIFHGRGSSIYPLVNVTIDNCTISNGAVATGATTYNTEITAGRDGIRLEWCQNCMIEGNNIQQVAGLYGIVTVNSKNITVQSNTVSDFGQGGIMNLVNSCSSGEHYATGTQVPCVDSGNDYSSSNILIGGTSLSPSLGNSVSNCLNSLPDSGGTALCYGIGVAGSEDGQAPPVSNTQVSYNTISNIPIWECLDSHGGSNETFTRNTCANSYYGISATALPAGSLSNITVSNNTVVENCAMLPNNGNYVAANELCASTLPPSITPKLNGYCITLSSSNLNSPVGTTIVSNNTCSGYGSSSTGPGAGVGAITLAGTNGVQVTANTCYTYYQACVDLYASNYNTQITGNTMYDIEGAYATTTTSNYQYGASAILMASPGSWGTIVDGNILTPSAVGTTPQSLFYNSYEGSQVSFDSQNVMNGSQTTITGSTTTASLVNGGFYPMDLPTNLAWDPNLFCYENGTIGYGASDNPLYLFSGAGTERGTGYFCEDSTRIIATGAQTTSGGSAVITSLTGTGSILGCYGAYWYYCLPPNMNVIVNGTNAQVLQVNISGNSITLDQIIPESSTVNITWLSGNVAAY
jgi:parallel beta-helix repeat protein